MGSIFFAGDLKVKINEAGNRWNFITFFLWEMREILEKPLIWKYVWIFKILQKPRQFPAPP